MEPVLPVRTGWMLSRASVRGKSHVDGGLPNQDCIEVATSPDGRVMVAVVSDGAGTAPRAEEGARTTCRLMVSWMLDIAHDMSRARLDQGMVLDRVALGLEAVRELLAARGDPLASFHCTFVACVVTEQGGWLCRIGDSIGLTSRFAEVAGGERRVDFFPDDGTRVHQADRGEFANETHFVTEADWRSHLHVDALDPRADALLLMSDGAMDVVITGGKVFRGFLSNLVARLLEMPDDRERDEVVDHWLADRRTYPVTGDDKTLFVAIRRERLRYAGWDVHTGSTESTPMVLPPPTACTSKPLPVAVPVPMPALSHDVAPIPWRWGAAWGTSVVLLLVTMAVVHGRSNRDEPAVVERSDGPSRAASKVSAKPAAPVVGLAAVAPPTGWQLTPVGPGLSVLSAKQGTERYELGSLKFPRDATSSTQRPPVECQPDGRLGAWSCRVLGVALGDERALPQHIDVEYVDRETGRRHSVRMPLALAAPEPGRRTP